MRADFIARATDQGRRIAIVDVPLLFETGGDAAVDLAVVVSAPRAVQRARALSREGMTEEKLGAILGRQMERFGEAPPGPFRHRHGGSFAATRAQIAQFLRAAAGLEGRKSGHA